MKRLLVAYRIPCLGLLRSRWTLFLGTLGLVLAVAVAAPATRFPLLRGAGWALVTKDVTAPVDVIVLSPSTVGAGPLEAADLVQKNIASRVAVFTDPPTGDDLEFVRRGLPYEDTTARQMRQLEALGVTDVVQIASTASLSVVLSQWCDQHRFRSIVFVTQRAESRRMQRMLNRVMSGHSTRVTVQPARYSGFDPDRWWETRGGVRTEIMEMQKLIADYILHPFSP